MNLLRRIVAREYSFMLAAPALVWQTMFVYAPIVMTLFYSILHPIAYAHGKMVFGLFNYQSVTAPIYLVTITHSCFLALGTALMCLLIAYPIAYHLAFRASKWKTTLLCLLILPSWTSLIVQVYAWAFLLQKSGPVSFLLYNLGIIKEPIHFLNNTFAMMIGMVYCFLPFMAIPLYVTLEKMDKTLLEASADLGATRFQTFWHVIFPISFPGIAAGSLLVLVPAFGEFAIPELLGGAKYALWGSLIASKFVTEHNLHQGAALTYVGISMLASFFALLYLTWIVYRFICKKLYSPRLRQRVVATPSGNPFEWQEHYHGRE